MTLRHFAPQPAALPIEQVHEHLYHLDLPEKMERIHREHTRPRVSFSAPPLKTHF